MTILNVYPEPDQVLIAADTKASAHDGSRREVSKLVPIIHLNAVVGCRGHLGFLQGLAAMCQSATGDFDSLIDVMPKLMQRAYEGFTNVLAELEIPIDLRFPVAEQHVVLAGWSCRAGRMVALEFRPGESGEFGGAEICGQWIAPWTEQLERDFSAPQTIESMEALARAQIRLYERWAPWARTGGRLIAVELGRSGMQVRPICDLH